MRWPNWLRRRGRTAAPTKLTGPLREFVYLDEVSVYSLLASRGGAVVSELTESQSSTSTSEVGGTVRGTVGVLGSEVRSKLQDTQASGTQVVRKAIVQASFKELIEAQQVSLALRPQAEDDLDDRPSDGHALAQAAEEGRWSGRIVDPDRLQRGDLVEIRVELEAAPIFRFGTTLSSLIDMFKDTPELFGQGGQAEMAQGIAVSKVLDALLAGLVPIRGRAVEFRHVTVGGRSLIVHREMLSDAVVDPAVEVKPLYVVGVAERALFWKDIRRLLFSRSTYTVLCRLSRDGISDRWTPVKLVDVVGEFLPDVARQIDDAQDGLTSLAAVEVVESADGTKRALADALARYAAARAEQAQVAVDTEALEADAAAIAASCPGDDSVEATRQAFKEIDAVLRDRHNLGTDDPLQASELRGESLASSGLEADGAPASTPALPPSRTTHERRERYLDCEFIAIYW